MQGTSNSHNQISLSEDCCHISTNTDSELTIIDSVSLGKLVRDVISSIEYDPVLLDVNLYDLVIETPILNMTVTNFTLASIPLLPGPNNLLLLTENQDSDFLNQLNATVYSVLYVGSSPTSLELLVDMSIFNPTNITFDLPNEVLELGVIYNNTNLAYGTIKDVFIPQNEQVNMSVGCTIKSETNEDKAVLEYFLSEFVSGGYENSSIKINIGNNHVYNNPGLNKLVEQINITNLTIPNISLPLPEESEQVAVKSCPFIVQATIHIFSSEVELTVFNPIVNHELIVEVFQAEAKYKDVVLGYLQQRERLIVPPGIYKTPKLPIKINSIGMDVLKKAMNGELDVEVLAILNVQLDEFDVNLFYKGNGLKSKIGF
ncbi:uncharacterized protein SPAPADRAFT_63764 [Spathaspora passalidarum NRRL Y-27907]|uniref:Tag1-like fifth Ig-like domain-containing protein n=1 Tax=Spathaspora passalidarum (strain NRRL Y-27907 / 11-Y1) TaxID=619300 RepID=G3AVD6_SPAPN|nr:uncharacterized protein SPAPADRAFT_63764 [Spathaspora passalidarum NRRL Y-27907]EGW30155.1 hypothetical protein SPAPADRAFT_63764 [Spathaspora passalidarum NRRL Y-27907]